MNGQLLFRLRFSLCGRSRQPADGSLMKNLIRLAESAFSFTPPGEWHMTATSLWQFFLHSSVADRGDLANSEGVFVSNGRMSVFGQDDETRVEWQRT